MLSLIQKVDSCDSAVFLKAPASFSNFRLVDKKLKEKWKLKIENFPRFYDYNFYKKM